MYDPARDIFTENQPSSSSSPPTESYDLSALDTLAGLAAEAEVASFPVKQEKASEITKNPIEPIVQDVVKGNGTVEKVRDEIRDPEINDVIQGVGGVKVARTKETELSLKVTLHLKKDKHKPKQEDMPEGEKDKVDEGEKQFLEEEKETIVDSKPDEPSQTSPIKVSSPPAKTSPKEPPKIMSPKIMSPTAESPKTASPKATIPKKEDATTQDESRTDKGDHSYPIPLSLSKLTKIPKRKVEDRRERPDREHRPNRLPDRDRDRDRRMSRPSRSPPPHPRSPSYRNRSPVRRLSDDRYRPNQHQHIDSYRPSRDRDDHYVPPKRPRSPSPPRQLKRPIRREVTAADRERERRERQQREAERERAELEAARSRPVYETVRQHYNDREDRGREVRQESRIFRLRKFNNWIKSVLIAKFIPERTEEQIDEDRGLFVLDIGCGKGGDLGKWQKQNQVQAYVGVDVAEVSIMHAENRAAELRGRRFSTRFFAMDCFVDPIRARLAPEHPLFDIVSMQFVMHYAFESQEKARTMLQNVSKNLRRGGYFIGTIPSSDAIIEGIKSLPEDKKEFGNSIYTVRFPERPTQTVFRPPYGHRYNFYMEDAVGNVPEYIVPFEVFRGLAEDANLEMVYRRSFHEIYEDEKDDEVNGRLMDRMGVKDEDGHRGIKGEEWEASGLYLAFAFEKRGGY